MAKGGGKGGQPARSGSGSSARTAPSTPGASVLGAAPSSELKSIWSHLLHDYVSKTPRRLQLIDAFLAYTFCTGVIQALYCLLVGTFPFNSFLAGFLSCVASFVFAGRFCVSVLFEHVSSVNVSLFVAGLRLQTAHPGEFGPSEGSKPRRMTTERAFSDWAVCNILLHLVVLTFVG